jgi:hypothetical protein
MSKINYNPKTHRQNAENVKLNKRRQELAEYEILEDDILFLSGLYVGKKLSEVWKISKEARDWVIKSLWALGNEDVNKVIRLYLCE